MPAEVVDDDERLAVVHRSVREAAASVALTRPPHREVTLRHLLRTATAGGGSTAQISCA